MKIRLNGRLLAGVLISLLAVFFFLQKVSLSDMIASFSHVNPLWLTGAVLAIFAALYTRTLVWRILLQQDQLSVKRLYAILLISTFLNNVLPARLGDVTRIYLTWKDLQVKRTQGIMSVLLEKLIDLIWLAALLLFTLLFVGTDKSLFQKNGLFFLGVILVGFIVFLVFLKNRVAVIEWLKARKERLNKGSQKKIWLFDTLINLFEGVPNKKRTLQAVLLHGLTWLFSLLTVWLAMRSFDITLSPYGALLTLVLTNLGMLIPSTPGALGVYHYLAYLSLTLSGIAEGTATSFAIFLHLLQYIPLLLVGFVVWIRYSKNSEVKPFNRLMTFKGEVEVHE